MTSATPRPAWSRRSAPGVRALRIATVVALAFGVFTTIVAYPSLPAVVPTHFDLTGEADAFGSSSSILALASWWAVVQLLLVWLSLHPDWAAVPGRMVEAFAQDVYREIERTMVLLGVTVAIAFGGVVLAVVGGPGIVVTMIGIVAAIVVTAVGIARILRAGRGGSHP